MTGNNYERRLRVLEERVKPGGGCPPTVLVFAHGHETNEEAAARQGVALGDPSQLIIVIRWIKAIDGRPAPGQHVGGRP